MAKNPNTIAPVSAHGHCSAQFEPLRQLFTSNLNTGVDLGASLAITIDGEFVVDLFGGWADEARSLPWSADTLTLVFSTTKMMSALAALVLVDRGELDLDAPVAKYWPEFAAQGKSGVLVRHVLSHSSGVAGWQEPITMADVCDWEKSTALLAAQAPWWEPGSACGYQLMCHGHLIGELVRRVTGLKLSPFFANEIARPLGADFLMGVGKAEYPRIATHVLPSEPPGYDLSKLDPHGVPAKTLLNPPNDPAYRLTDNYRPADIGASNGYGNAHSVSRVLSLLANDGRSNGLKLMTPKTINRIFEPQVTGIDRVLGIPLSWGVGYALPIAPMMPFLSPNSKVCFWGGYGGSMTLIDVGRRMTISFVMNKLNNGIIGGPRISTLLQTAYACVNDGEP